MDYIELLTKIIKESKLTHEEITDRCEADGVSFNYNYISTIKNRGSIPSDEISRAIARVCGRHEDLLVTQAYYDKSPKAFKDMFDSIIGIVKATILMYLTQQSDEAAINMVGQKLDKMAIAEWLEFDLSDTAKQTDDFFAALTNIGGLGELANTFGATDGAENVCSHIAPDNSMSPAIPDGAQVYTMMVALESLKDGDFICRQKDGEVCMRQIVFLENVSNKMLLLPYDIRHYEKDIIDISNKQLYEKVVQIVIDFE